MSVREFLNTKVKSKIDAQPMVLAGNGFAGKSVCLELTGSESSIWTFSFLEDDSLQMNEGKGQPDCGIEMKAETFELLIKGSLNVPLALMTRKIKVHGESALAARIGMALQNLFK